MFICSLAGSLSNLLLTHPTGRWLPYARLARLVSDASVCLCICVSVCLWMMPICVSVCVCDSLCVYVCVSVCVWVQVTIGGEDLSSNKRVTQIVEVVEERDRERKLKGLLEVTHKQPPGSPQDSWGRKMK